MAFHFFIWWLESWKDRLESDAWIWKIMFLFRLLRQCFALFWTFSDIRFIIRIRIRNFGYPKVGYPKFRIRIRIVKSTIRNVRISDFRISEISDIRF
ncbi:hypothetical protein Hanom_Chr02g00104971 [Helianthus anomalus]